MRKNGSDSTDIRLVNRSDLILILAIALIGLCVLVMVTFTRKPGRMVRVSLEGREIGAYPLDKDIRLAFGPEGLKKAGSDAGTEESKETGKDSGFSNILEIRDGAADMRQADCPDKICVEHKPISKLGETIVCLPHKLVVEVVDPGSDRTGEDADVIAR